ncbi:MAG: hypothetical protein KKI09_07645 [Spirochaetes bacterium]|nr:hypothetical protein [Spirochaetota bacterium]MBU0955286.1 hypothetical protein [Spirochaetota bacterium]
MRKKKKVAEQYQVELVFMTLYDIGRSIDLSLAASLLPGIPGMKVVRRRDTPESLLMPKPLCVDLRTGPQKAFSDEAVEGLSVAARIYDEGVLSIIMRLRVMANLEDLHGLAERRLSSAVADLESYSTERFNAVVEILKPAIDRDHTWLQAEQESYTAFCFSDVGMSPVDFLTKNAQDLTTLLNGDPYGSPLHDSQIRKTLANPFSYNSTDLALFDMDRALLIDPDRDYEDLLLICELANYQFLELRVLDHLLDHWLDEAEDDIRLFYSKERSRRKKRSSLQRKFATLQGLRLDALFILENIENSSKIIGDYFLGTLYEHLCGIFNTPGWTRSVERRLDALQHVYEIVKAEKNERTMLLLEIIFIVVCIIPIIQFAFG